ncbi:MAG: hypothetical protein D6796_17400, partial [Caldilineae bacterium]
GWSGDASGTTNPLTLTVTGDLSVTATFSQNPVDHTPALAVTADGAAAATVGDTIVYTVTVTNDPVTGDGSPIGGLSVSGDVSGAATYLSGDADGDGWLEAGETWVYRATYTAQSGDVGQLVNTFTASGQDAHTTQISAPAPPPPTGFFLFLPMVMR